MRYLYTYACHEDEQELCRLELSTLFGVRLSMEQKGRWLTSERAIDPSRSPFLKRRIEIQLEAPSLPELCELASGLEVREATFKVVYTETEPQADYEQQRASERRVGARIRGKADMRQPERTYGLACVQGRWVLGELRYAEAVWLQHVQKPRQYSTALSTRVARAIANIAVPEPQGLRAVDPCCGIGTVLIEAMSMKIDMVGFDMNPLAVQGARANLKHFGYPDVVKLADMRTLEPANYAAAVLDMPYNLCSKLSSEEQLLMLVSLRRLASRSVIVTIEDIDTALITSGLQVVDRCLLHKGSFTRQVILCQA